MTLAFSDITFTEAEETGGYRLTGSADIAGQTRSLEAFIPNDRYSPGAVRRHKDSLHRQLRKLTEGW